MKKEMIKFFDLYGSSVIFTNLKQNFIFVSICNKSIPTAGSNTKKSSLLMDDAVSKLNIEKIIKHRDNSITLKISYYGYMRFFN